MQLNGGGLGVLSGRLPELKADRTSLNQRIGEKSLYMVLVHTLPTSRGILHTFGPFRLCYPIWKMCMQA